MDGGDGEQEVAGVEVPLSQALENNQAVVGRILNTPQLPTLTPSARDVMSYHVHGFADVIKIISQLTRVHQKGDESKDGQI